VKRTRAAAVGLFATAFALEGCKRGGSGADAGPPLGFLDPALAVALPVPPTWIRQEPGDGGESPSRPFDARRVAPEGRTLLVAPRIVVTVEPAHPADDASRLSEAFLADMKRLESAGQARIRRTTSVKHTVDGVEVADLEVDYSVVNPGGGPEKDVVHRALVLRRGTDSEPKALAVSATYLASDEEWLGPEVERILRGLRIGEAALAEPAPEPPDAGAAKP
jgi:hypothetical protein